MLSSHLSVPARFCTIARAWAAIAALVLVGLTSAASAQTAVTWIGGGVDGNWATAGNWAGGAPLTTGTYDLTFSGSVRTTSTNNVGVASSSIAVSTLTFANNGTNASSAFGLNGTESRTLTIVPNGLIQTAACPGPLNLITDNINASLGIVVGGTTTFSIGAFHRLNVNATVTGTGSLIKTGTGELALFTAPTVFDRFQVDAGTLTFNSQVTQNGAVGKPFEMNGGRVNVGTGTTGFSLSLNASGTWRAYSGQSATSTAISFNTPTTTGSDVILTLVQAPGGASAIAGRIQDNLVRSVGVNVAANASDVTFTLSGSNSFSGGTTVTSGTLIVAHANALGNGGLAVNTSGVLINGLDALVNGPLTGSAAGVIASRTGASTLTVNTTATSTYAGALLNGGGTLAFVKAGSGLLALSGSSAYTGATAVNGGGLAIDGSLGTTPLSVAAAAWLQGTGTTAGSVNVLGTLAPGNGAGVLTVGSAVLGASSATLIEITGTSRGTQYDGVNITGTSGSLGYGGVLSLDFASLSPNDVTYDLFRFTGDFAGSFTSVTSTGAYVGTWTNLSGSGTFQFESEGGQTLTFSPSTGDLVVVPEPTSLALAATGLAAAVGLAHLRRRRVPNVRA
jgi:fibronectin-binding autotransporter adhesin